MNPTPAIFFIAMLLALVPQNLEAAKPNVLLICVDDLKPTLGCYGDSAALTPNIDALAQRGVLFEKAYCNQAVCAPSRNSLMTGLRPQTIGVYDLPTHFRKAAPDAITITERFKKAGYHAAGLGKIYHIGHGNIDDKRSWSTPFWRGKAVSYADPENVAAIKPDAKGKKRGPSTESADVPDDTYRDGVIAAEAIRRLEAYQKDEDQPFFLAVGFAKPHLPFVAPKKYWDLFDPNQLPMPEVKVAPVDAPSFAGTRGGELMNYSDMQGLKKVDAKTTRHLIHGYYAATSYVDAQIGRVLSALDQLELSENTVVILWGDHGWHLGDHGMWCKHTNYEQAAKIPLIVAAPGKASGVKTDAMVETVDIYPTLCELAGLPQPDSIDGLSFANVVQSPSEDARPYVTHVYPRGGKIGRAIRGPRYRMVEWKVAAAGPETAKIELYDYQTDPLETKNIAADNPQSVTTLRAQLAMQPEAKPQWKPVSKKSAGKKKK